MLHYHPNINTWNEAQVEELHQLFDEGNSMREIANVIGRTKNAVIGKVHRERWHMGPEVAEKRRRKAEEAAPARRRRRKRPEAKEVKSKPFHFGFAKPQLDKVDRKAFVYRPKPDPVEIKPLRVPLLELRHRQCKWPYGDEKFTFCGHKVYDGGPYCPGHAEMAFVPVQRRVRGADPRGPDARMTQEDNPDADK
jgi:GcrA cell cycle regulator